MRITIYANARAESLRQAVTLCERGETLELAFAAEVAVAAAELLERLRLLRDELGDVDRQPDRAALVGDGAADGLTDPPRRVGAEAEAPAVLEFLDGAHEAAVAFLDEVHEWHAAAGVLLRHADDEAQ